MAREKEIKIRLTKLELNDFIKRITKFGFKLVEIEQQEDIYFDTTDWFLYEHLSALRVRKIKGVDKSFSFKKMFYSSKRLDPYFIEELEVKLPVTDAATLKAITDKLKLPQLKSLPKNSDEITKYLQTHSYFDEQHMSKTRSVYKMGSNEIVVDELDQIGTVIELECANDEPLDLVNRFLKKGEWERSTEGTSYMWLTKVKGLKSHNGNVARFQNEPKWNVWPHEKSLYQNVVEAE